MTLIHVHQILNQSQRKLKISTPLLGKFCICLLMFADISILVMFHIGGNFTSGVGRKVIGNFIFYFRF